MAPRCGQQHNGRQRPAPGYPVRTHRLNFTGFRDDTGLVLRWAYGNGRRQQLAATDPQHASTPERQNVQAQ